MYDKILNISNKTIEIAIKILFLTEKYEVLTTILAFSTDIIEISIELLDILTEMFKFSAEIFKISLENLEILTEIYVILFEILNEKLE